MKRQDFYNEERALYDAENAEQNAQIRQLLEPKHAPHCDIKFRHQKRERTMMLRGFFNYTSIAAALVIGLFIGVGINHITAHENERIIAQAIKKHEAVESIIFEGKTRIMSFAKGDVKNLNFEYFDEEVEYTAKLLRKNGVVYTRTDYKDKDSTVDIYDGKQITVWKNGKQVFSMPTSKINTPMFDMLKLDNAISKVKETHDIDVVIKESGDKITTSYKLQKGDRYVAQTFSKTDKSLTSTRTYKIIDNNIVNLQSIDKIICNEPLSIEEIIAPPTK